MIKTTISPTRSRPSHKAPNLAVGTAADLEEDGEAEACPEDVVEDVACDKEDVPCVVGGWPSAVVRTGSAANWADTPDELVQAEFGDPTPATKFTCMHCSSQGRVRKASHIEHNPGR